MDKKSTLEKWFDEVWTKENASMIHQMFVPDPNEGAAGLKKDKGIGPDEFLIFHKQLLGLLKNVKIKIDQYMEQGDLISTECTLTAADRKTGQQTLTMKGCITARIVDGKIKSAHNHFDFLNLFEDLGLLPENTFATCLNGNSVC